MTTSAKGTPSGCPQCEMVGADEHWGERPLVQVLLGEDLVPSVVTRWTGRWIEVRKCVGCGQTVARMAQVAR
jgi:Zn ribbon nucleic-acid-binding protein